MKEYIGIKRIKAEPKQKTQLGVEGSSEPRTLEGYEVEYENGYVSWSPKDVFEKAYFPITLNEDVDTSVLEPHQLRVIEERQELSQKMTSLKMFLESDLFKEKVVLEEQKRLEFQFMTMFAYLSVLDARINNF